MIESGNIDLGNEAAKTLIQELAKKAVALISKAWKLKFPKKNIHENKFEFENKIAEHFTEMYKWSSNIEFIGIGRPLNVNDKTVTLDFSYNIRKLTNKNLADDLIEEKSLITENENFIILGDPGSGKSTTVKRLLNHFFFSRPSNNNRYNYPLLVKFREMKEFQNLYTYICDFLGINFETIEKTYEVKIEKTRPLLDNKGKYIYENGKYKNETYFEIEQRKRYEHYIEKQKIEIILPRLIEQNNLLLVMDGLDEVNYLIAQDVQKQIIDLSSKLINSKIIITCRPDYLEENFNDFILCQICDLTTSQSIAISKLWIKDTTEFIRSLEVKSYFDLSKRPLFLCFLLLLYKENGLLPPTSKEVYRQIIDLLILKWDKSRGFKRESKYSKFDIFKKVEFLSHLSFILTYLLKTKSFDNSNLQSAYLLINDRFDLPSEESFEVCKEIENHTGIIVKAFYDRYEFSHLSIQEYLCAIYILSAPYNDKVFEYLKESPAPVAMAISLSSESSLWFTKIVFDFLVKEYSISNKTEIAIVTKLAKIILRKLLIENPYFEKKDFLGLAILALCRLCDCSDIEFSDLISKFILHHKNVIESVNFALRNYRYLAVDQNGNKLNLIRQSYFQIENIRNDDFVSKLSLPLNLSDPLLEIPEKLN